MIELDEYAQKAALELTGEKLNSQVDLDISAMGKRLSDDLAEMKRMEYLMSKAPCIARLKELADWSEKKD